MKWSAGALLLASACTTPTGGEPPIPEHGGGPTGRCEASRGAELVGRESSQALGQRALQLSGAQRLRWIRPGDMVTMDFRTDRLNVHLDGRGRVERLSCG
jgi:hypothetical protein